MVLFYLLLAVFGLTYPGPAEPVNFEPNCPLLKCEFNEGREFNSEDHKALDLNGELGSTIFAAEEGTVLLAGWECEPAPCVARVIIEHPDGSRTGYYHMDPDVRVYPGQYIIQGTHIGNIGMTGRTSWPHLHFWMERHGRRVNPYLYLKATKIPRD